MQTVNVAHFEVASGHTGCAAIVVGSPNEGRGVPTAWCAVVVLR